MTRSGKSRTRGKACPGKAGLSATESERLCHGIIPCLCFRFGIEMVPNEQDCPRQEEEALLEGFDWDLVTDFSSQGPTRKRSLSESSLAPSSFSLSDPHASEEPLRGSEQLSATAPPQQHPAAHKQPDTLMSASVKVLQRSESVGGDSSSGMEQCDAQGSGKRRRAATVSLESTLQQRRHRFPAGLTLTLTRD